MVVDLFAHFLDNLYRLFATFSGVPSSHLVFSRFYFAFNLSFLRFSGFRLLNFYFEVEFLFDARSALFSVVQALKIGLSTMAGLRSPNDNSLSGL